MHNDDLDRDGRLKFLSFDDASRAALRRFWPVVEPRMEEILHEFYVHLRTVPVLDELLGTPQQAAWLKKAQKDHWKTLFDGTFDADYMQRARAIGEAHSRIGLEPRRYIGGYNLILNRLTAIAVREYPWRPQRLIGTRSEEHTSELQSIMRISYAVFCLKKKNKNQQKHN